MASVSSNIYHVEKMLQSDLLFASYVLIPIPYKGNDDWGTFIASCTLQNSLVVRFMRFNFCNFSSLTGKVMHKFVRKHKFEEQPAESGQAKGRGLGHATPAAHSPQILLVSFR